MKDHSCVECGKQADRVCNTCGDKYCSIKWMGHPGCFELFHEKGNRAEHEFERFRPITAPKELVELEKKAKEALEMRKKMLEDMQREIDEEARRIEEEMKRKGNQLVRLVSFT